MKTNITRLALIFAVSTFAPAAFAQEEKKEDKKPAATDEKVVEVPEPGTIAASIRDGATFSILTKALQATGLDETLGTKGAYTVFAPTDEAFLKLPEGALDKLMLPENKEKLRSLLLYHVLPGTFTMAELKDGDIKTANGEKVEIDVKSDTKEVEDSKISKADLVTSNGVVHSIDKVLVPESLDDFAGLDAD
ncbi:fasciclin domain-containing protein [Luteolibacter flavescens]|uniref:Fasciclin domain-containing protein n=1 Tax=Luteolibacter flavescens TaxID=1859460 RepID=A0ABT3FU92_9BACT|nr:fasciclin domain-containing protein [Luteolibacter flavescens]MCW1887117.1 fasciclin domain-containing protein [Luteolibacter flavescens]